MPRRRMISPLFWQDPDIRKLTRDERLLFIGCFSNADDEGRLLAHPAHLKAAVFMYDDDLGLDEVKQLRDDMLSKVQNLVLYENAGEEYLAFLKWQKHQKPSHPRPSDLPAPQFTEPLQPNAGIVPEPFQPPARETPEALAPSLGQSSLGQVRLGKSRAVQEDFTEFLDLEKDLTDFLTKTLEKYLPRGPTWAVEVLQELWTQALGDRLKGAALELTLNAVKEYPAPVLARAYVKAVKYRGGKYDTAKYLDKILKEKESHGKGRGPP